MFEIYFEKNKLDEEDKKIASFCLANNITFHEVNTKQFEKNELSLTSKTLPIGNIHFLHFCFKKINRKHVYNCYPNELQKFLNRNIHEILMKKLPYNYPFFIKPSRRLKKFTGKIIQSSNDLYGISKNEYVWYSPCLDIVSEWRVYVKNGNIIFIAFCDGQKDKYPDRKIIDNIVESLNPTEYYFQGCVVDIAVTSQNQTLFLELNDGYSIGRYDNMPMEPYLNLLYNRWKANF